MPTTCHASSVLLEIAVVISGGEGSSARCFNGRPQRSFTPRSGAAGLPKAHILSSNESGRTPPFHLCFPVAYRECPEQSSNFFAHDGRGGPVESGRLRELRAQGARTVTQL